MFLPLYFAPLVALVVSSCACYLWNRKSHQQQEAELIEKLQEQADHAAASAAKALKGPPRLPRGDSAHGREAGVQDIAACPPCVRAWLAKAVRDDRQFKLYTLRHIGQVRLSPRGRWREVQATQHACPLEPAFVWTASASLAPLLSLAGCDSLVDGVGACSWWLWGLVLASEGSGAEVERALLTRWLAEAATFPHALLPSRHLRWEAVKGCNSGAEAVLTYGGVTVRGVFGFDAWGRVESFRSRDFCRRLPSGAFETGQWHVKYCRNMRFGLTPQGPVLSEKVSAQGGIDIPTGLEASWVSADGAPWCYAQLTVSKVTVQ